MSKSYWLPVTLTIGFIATLLLVAWFFQPRAPSACEQKSEYAETNYTYGIQKNPDGWPQIVVEAKAKAEPCDKRKEPNPQPLNEPNLTISESDLLAQERMAYWTVWIGIFTALGLGALVCTLWETRRAVDESANATKAARDSVNEARLSRETQAQQIYRTNKPHVVASNARIVFREDFGIICFIVDLTNIGNSPALEIEATNSVILEPTFRQDRQPREQLIHRSNGLTCLVRTHLATGEVARNVELCLPAIAFEPCFPTGPSATDLELIPCNFDLRIKFGSLLAHEDERESLFFSFSAIAHEMLRAETDLVQPLRQSIRFREGLAHNENQNADNNQA